LLQNSQNLEQLHSMPLDGLKHIAATVHVCDRHLHRDLPRR
jgi:hypothetical protein